MLDISFSEDVFLLCQCSVVRVRVYTAQKNERRGILTSNLEAPENTCEYTVPAATWAIFECIGPMPQAIQELQKRIMTEWLSASGYEYGDAPDIELYYEGDMQSPEYRSEVWLPVVKKS